MQTAERNPCNAAYTLPDEIASVMGTLISRATKAHFENPDNRRAFEKWYAGRYGKPYQWGKENHYENTVQV